MAKCRINFTGKIIGDLSVLKEISRDEKGHRRWNCHCICGKVIIRNKQQLSRKSKPNCGCSTDISGKQYGDLVVIGPSQTTDSGGKKQYYSCKCSCGFIWEVRADGIKNGKVQRCISCSAKNRVTHGKTKSREYKSWVSMKQRCDNPRAPNYFRYGGIGIEYQLSWASFEAFHVDMGDRPPNTSLDRIDPEGDYTCENCRWACHSIQSSNKRGNQSPKYIGVSRVGVKFLASLGYNKEKYRLGLFETASQAARAYDDKFEEFHGYRLNQEEFGYDA